MPVFKHVNLEVSETEYNGKKIEVRQNIERTWDVWLNGNRIEHDPFSTRKEAINHVINVINKLSPPPITKNSDLGKFKTRPKHQGRPKASNHSSVKTASKELKSRRVR